MTLRIRTPQQMELARTIAACFAVGAHPGGWYSEQLSPTEWPPHDAKASDGVNKFQPEPAHQLLK
ncbi:hypothetical protein [Marivita sp.]|uniref:hypothetical protein n=1 Tax=Marivita sp. TaxID=2003365 RepID=UPI00260187FF|nr:hypothetical protein [Marivita sp.]